MAALRAPSLFAHVVLAVFVAPLVAAHSPNGNAVVPLDVSSDFLGAGFDPSIAALSFVPSTEDGSDPNSDDAVYGIKFKCPTPTQQVDPQVLVLTLTCPYYVIDREDFLGQPALVIDPQNPDVMAFHSLHGGIGIHLDPPLGDGQPPTGRSRYNILHQPHTTFQSVSGGSQWLDNRYYAPASLVAPGRVVYGEDNAATMDAAGNLYLASLYSWRDKGETDYHYTVATWKGGRANRPISYYENLQILHQPDDVEGRGNSLNSLFLTHSREANRLVVLWLENAGNGTISPNGYKSWVMAYSTTAGEGLHWDRLPITQQVGPCRSLSRPVAHNGQIYFGCLPAEGYTFGQASGSDRWQIHSLDPTTLATSYQGPVPIGSDNGLLVDFADTGHMLFIGSEVDSDGRPHVWASKGAEGSNWTDPKDFGDRLAQTRPGGKVLEARVTAAAYTKHTGYIHLIYTERYASTPDAATIAGGQVRTMAKTYGVLRWAGDQVVWQGKFDDLGYGRTFANFQPSPFYGGLGNDALFYDLHDDIRIWRDAHTAKERIFVAFGDYGTTRFGEIVEQNAAFAFPLPPLSAPPIPLAAQAANAAAQGAAAGVLAAAMLMRLLMARKTAVHKVTA